ncbi:TRAP transporter substrate-binding protein DctP [Pseudovibrio exalbescens]|uniref:TRAP transporter substrate-binding protein n=1 Tax=Pseudovibrio exalbescens TaxID=197461 RepID=UPI0023653FFC|nr:TRAP transporter substrate-binding protein DctP [Pseudovibrio exalbescens]MDD7912085.1 TRAP transporter substrate-binding protein DctP [Pseudovibrio exalbescens]
MKRRDFLKTAGATGAVLGAGSLTAPALANATLKLKLVGAFPKGFPGVGTSAEQLAKRIEALSDGKIEITYYGGGELVPPFEVFSAVASGAADIGHNAPYYQVGQVRSTMYFTSMPYGLDAEELSAWVRFGGGQALWDEAYAPHGVKPFYAGSSGVQAAGWFKKEITTLDDLVGLKMRIAGLGGDIMRKLGVTTVLTPPPEIYSALQSGVVDAAEFVGPWNDMALGFAKVAPYYYLPAFHEPGPGLEMIVNQNLYENMSPHLKTVLDNAATAQAESTTSEFRYNNTKLLPALIEQGAIISAFPDDVVSALGAAAKEVIADYPGNDAMSLKIHEAYLEYMKACALYTKGMEGRLYTDRATVWGV